MVSTKCGQSCEWTVPKTRQLKLGHFGSDFRKWAPSIYKHMYVCGKSKVPPEATHVEIVVCCAVQAVPVAYPIVLLQAA